MSSVSGSSGSGQDESVRRIREEARKREAELIKKNAKQLAAADKKHAEEIQRLEEQHNANLKNLREKSKEAITRRDQKFQKVMEEIRNLHSKQLERLMAENEEKMALQREVAKNEMKQANLGKNDRVQELHEKYATTLNEQQKTYIDQVEEMREAQRKSTDKIRNDLTEAHKKEMEAFRDYHLETTSKLKNDLRTTRNSANQRLRNQEVRHLSEKARLEDTNLENVRQLSIDHNDIQQQTREGYEESLKEMRMKFAQAQENEAARRAEIENGWKADVQDRIESRERRLEQQLAAERQNHVRQQNKIDRSSKSEIRAMRDEYQKKYDYLEQARRDTLTQAKEDTARDIARVRKEIGDAQRLHAKQIKESSEIEKFRNRQAYEELKKEAQLREAYQRDHADRRVNHIKQESNLKDARLREKYNGNLEMMREAYENEIRELRLAAEKDKNEAVVQLKDQMQRKEVEHRRQMADVVAKYEKRLGELNDQFMREKRLRDNREKQLIEQLKKGQEAQIEALRLKYEEQSRQANAQHERELRDVTRRHKEQVDNIMSTIKKT